MVHAFFVELVDSPQKCSCSFCSLDTVYDSQNFLLILASNKVNSSYKPTIKKDQW